MSKWPVHHNPRERAAKAPYNFVPLPERVLTVDPESLPDQDRYYPDQYTGWIDCDLTTASPLYVRAALELDEFERSQDEKAEEKLPWREQVRHKPDFFYTEDPLRPLIPGSSLRGMLRALVEIVGYGKMQWVTDQQRYFFRAVAAPRSDPLARPYRDALGKVEAGYVVKHGEKWYILPAKQIRGESFLKVKEQHVPRTVLRHHFNEPDYRPDYIEVSFTTKRTPRGRWVIERVGKRGEYPNQGTMVCTGSMSKAGGESPRRNHSIVSAADVGERVAIKDLIPIDDDAIRDYRASLTDFQKQDPPFNRQMGCLVEGRPIFYLVSPDDVIRAFGHTPNFRIPFRRKDAQRASSPRDYVPEILRQEDDDTDLAEAMFGYTKAKGEGKARAFAGRIFVTDARLNEGQDQVWLADEEPVEPKILGSPKPTTFQHYLVQTAPNQSVRLLHYASDTPGETVIRGHKLYWHKGTVKLEDIQEPEQVSDQDTQHTWIRPVKAGVTFGFQIRFENLSDVELGALLWVLDKAQDEDYRLKLGMGKPYGMGAVKIEATLHLTDRAQRYRRLFQDERWARGNKTEENLVEKTVEAFEQLILDNNVLNPTDAQSLAEVDRIQALLAMLSWPGPDARQTRYLLIEHPKYGNEYKGRPVLPDPLAVSGRQAPLDRIRPGFRQGTVKDFGLGRSRSFGFIVPDDGGPDVFVHKSDLVQGVTTLTRGQKVIFRQVQGMKGPKAEDVQPWPD